MSRKTTQPIISRTVADPNFAHVISMFPLMRMWAGSVERGHKLDASGIPMIHMPVEIAEALIRERAQQPDEVGIACQKAIAAIDSGDPLLAVRTITNAEAAYAE